MDETDCSLNNSTSDPAWLNLDSRKDESSASLALYPESPQMIEACATGDMDMIQELLRSAVASHSDSPIANFHRLSRGQMMTQAIKYKQSAVVELLLLTYPEWRVCEDWILSTAFENPHYQTFRLLHAHDPQIINYEFPTNIWTSLMEACTGGDPLIPNYLIDQGAWLNEGGFADEGPLWAAVLKGQPLTLIGRMIDGGARITGSTLLAAIDRQNLEILEEILGRCTLQDWQCYIDWAKKRNNADVIRMVEQRAKKKKSCWPKRKQKATLSTTEKPRSQIRWWPFHNGNTP